MQPPSLEQLAAEHGVHTARGLVAEGASPRTLRRRATDGGLQRLHHGIYVGAEVEVDATVRAWAAAVAAGPGAVPSHRTAAAVLGMWLPPHWYGEPADVIVPLRVSRPRRPTLVSYRRILRHDECVVGEGLVITGPARTVSDLARDFGRFAGVIAAESAVRSGRLTLDQVRALPFGELADPRSESPAETLARLTLLDGGIALEPQYEFYDEYARCYRRLDLADPVRRVGVEVDGRGYREDQLDPAYVDRHKHNLLGRGDWVLLRFTWRDLGRRPDYVVRCVREALAGRAA